MYRDTRDLALGTCKAGRRPRVCPPAALEKARNELFEVCTSARNRWTLPGAARSISKRLSHLGPRNILACVPGPGPLRTSSPNPSSHPTPLPTVLHFRQSTIATPNAPATFWRSRDLPRSPSLHPFLEPLRCLAWPGWVLEFVTQYPCSHFRRHRHHEATTPKSARSSPPSPCSERLCRHHQIRHRRYPGCAGPTPRVL